MQSTLVFKLFTCLKRQEIEKFKTWLRMASTQVGAHEWLVQQMENKISRDLVLYKMVESSIFEKVQTQIQAEKHLPEVCRGVKAHLSDYLAFESLRKNKHEKGIHLVQEIRRRRKIDVFPIFWKHTYNELLKERVPKNARYYRTEHDLETIYHEFLLEHEKEKRKHRLGEMSKAFDNWWLERKWVLTLAILTRNTFQKHPIPPEFLFQEESIEKLKTLYDSSPGMKEFLKMLGSPNSDELAISLIIEDFRSKERKRPLMDRETLKNVFHFLHNYLVRKANVQGTAEIYDLFATFYEWGLEDQLLHDGKNLLLGHYDHVIAVFRQAGRNAEALNHAQVLSLKVPQRDRQESLAFQMGLCLIESGELEEAEKWLTSVNFSRAKYKIQARFARLQIAYDRKTYSEKEDLIQQISNLYETTRTHSNLTPTFQKTSLYRTNLFRKYMKLYYPNEFRALRKEVLELRPLTTRKWLLERIDQRLNPESNP